MLVKNKSGLKAKQLSARILLYQGKDIKRKNDDDDALYCVFCFLFLPYAVGCTDEFLVVEYSGACHKHENHGNSWQAGRKLYAECTVGRGKIA